MPHWTSCGTSNIIYKLKIQKCLLGNKPTSYRKQFVLKLENQVSDSAKENRFVYQEKLLGSKNTDGIFEHLKSQNNLACLPKVFMNDTKQSSLRCKQVNMLNEFFHSLLSPKTYLGFERFQSTEALSYKF